MSHSRFLVLAAEQSVDRGTKQMLDLR